MHPKKQPKEEKIINSLIFTNADFLHAQNRNFARHHSNKTKK